MKKTIITTILLCWVFGNALAQGVPGSAPEKKQSDPFSRKFRWGITGNQYWGTIRGADVQQDYFGKPCLGWGLKTEFYPLSFLGVTLGAGFQQRGAGIITPDKSGGSFTHPWEYPQFDPDSTYRRRLRFSTFEVPVALLLRAPKDLVRGVRPSASIGMSFVRVRNVHDFFMSVEDGYHTDIVVTSQYASRDRTTHVSAGVDIDAGGAGVLQVHLVYTKGSQNVYASGTGDGRLVTYGFRLAWLY